MDSTQDPFTRRMLQRAASVRRNREGSLRFKFDDSRRKINILQAIGDKPVKIADVADCQIGNGTGTISANSVITKNKQSRALRRTNHANSDSLISERSNLSGFYPKSQSSTSNLSGKFKTSDADCENADNLWKFSNKRADRPNERIDGEDLSPKNFKDLEFETPIDGNEKHRRTETENKISEKNFINEVMALARQNKSLRSQNSGAKDANFETKSKFEESVYSTENRNESLSTQTHDHTSLNLTKDSLSSSTYTKGFELGNVKWRGPLYKASVKSQTKYNRDFLEDTPGIELSQKLYNLDEPELVKIQQKEISTPPRRRAELKTIGNYDKPEVLGSVNDEPRSRRPERLSLRLNMPEVKLKPKMDGGFETIPENPNSPITPLSAEIQQLDADIKSLEFHPGLCTPGNGVELSPPNRIYPNLSKIKFTSTGYSPKKLYQSPCSPEDPSESSCLRKLDLITNEEKLDYQKGSNLKNQTRVTEGPNHPLQANGGINPNTFARENYNEKSERGDTFKPNMESTRQSSPDNLLENIGSPNREGESSVPSVTTGPETPESLQSASTSSPPGDKNLTLSSTVPYDVDNFLADALGDELYNTTVTYPPSEGHDRSVSQFNASELISETRTPLQLKKNKKSSKKIPATDPSPQHSSTFNRTMTIYRSFTERIKNKLRPGLRSVPKVTTNDSEMTEESTREDKKIQALLQEANIQQTLMYQANKALTFCRSMKEFTASTEQVESERSLLVAGLRRTAALDQIKKLDCELNNNEDHSSDEKGEVAIKDFSLPLKEEVLKYEAQTGDFVQWFVIVVCHGATVWATRAVSCPVQSPRIIFNGEFLLSNLSPSFKITVKIYSLKMRRTTFNYDDKYHLNQTEKNSRCPSPKKLILRKSDRSLSPKEIQQIEISAIRNTSFVLSGMVELYLHDLSLTAPWPLISLLPGSVLQGTIDLSLSCKLHLSVSHAGFLTHGDEAGGLATWNRRWCVLQGQSLKFWNYPCDQEDKEPLAVIDLTSCISDEIDVVNRSLCAKPRTLLIETTRRRSILDKNSMLLECRLSCTIVRNLLCCDTSQDFIQWKSKLNHVVSALRDWNVTKRSLQDVQVSDL